MYIEDLEKVHLDGHSLRQSVDMAFDASKRQELAVQANPHDYQAIRNVIAKYCFALDAKDYELLREVFTNDVDTIYPFRGEIKGVKEVIDAISNRLDPLLAEVYVRSLMEMQA